MLRITWDSNDFALWFGYSAGYGFGARSFYAFIVNAVIMAVVITLWGIIADTINKRKS